MSVYKEIIQESWEITKEYKSKLFKFWFVPSLFTSILWIIWISYQIIAFKNSSYIPWEFSFWFEDIAIITWWWVKMHWLASFLIWLFLIFSFAMYTILPSICEWSIIYYVNQIKNWKSLEKLSWWLWAWLWNFYKMFELSAILAPFHIFTLISEWSFFARNLWEKFFSILLPFLIFLFFVSIIINFLFAFSSQYLIIEKKSVMWSINASSWMVMRNIKDIFFLWWIVLLIIIRIFVNIFIILLIPLIIFFVLTFFATTNYFSIWVIIWWIISAFLIWVSAYLLWWFNVFINTFWTISYFKFKKIEEDD